MKLRTVTHNTTLQSAPYQMLKTSNVTGRHRGPKRKLRVGYRAPSLKRTSCPKRLHYNARHIFHRWVWYRALSLHHLHPLGDLCAKFRFSGVLRFWAGPRRKIAYSINHSVIHSVTHSPSLFDAPGPGAEAFASRLEFLKNSRWWTASFWKYLYLIITTVSP